MCTIVVINRGEKEIETPNQFKSHFGFEPLPDKFYKNVNPNSCLCQCNLEETFIKHDIPFKMSAGDYYVGLLDQVKGDNE